MAVNREGGAPTGATSIGSLLPNTVVRTDGSVVMDGNLNLNNNIITGVTDGVSDSDAVTLKQLNDAISTVVTGISHGAAVRNITKDVPTTPIADEFYIVAAGITDTTDPWFGHTNEIAYWDGTAWVFVDPEADEAHLNEEDNAIYHWSPDATTPTDISKGKWNKIASGSVTTASKMGVGELVAWPSNTALPDDLLELKGQVLAIASYKDLHDVVGNQYNTGTSADGVTTFALPDYRGYFLRGTSEDATIDPDGPRIANDKQQDATQHLTGFIGSTFQGLSAHTGTGPFRGDGSRSQPRYSGPIASGQQALGWSFDNSRSIRTATEDRPKNVAVKWCIRCKPIATGPRGPAGKGYVNGTAKGQTLTWSGTAWVAGSLTLGLVHSNSFTGSEPNKRLDRFVIASTTTNDKYKITATAHTEWNLDGQNGDLVVTSDSTEIARTQSHGPAHYNNPSIVCVVDGSGAAQVIELHFEGAGALIKQYHWTIERVK